MQPTLTIDEAAERLGVTVQTVRRWAHAGVLPYTRTELGAFRFAVSDLDAAARARSVRWSRPKGQAS